MLIIPNCVEEVALFVLSATLEQHLQSPAARKPQTSGGSVIVLFSTDAVDKWLIIAALDNGIEQLDLDCLRSPVDLQKS